MFDCASFVGNVMGSLNKVTVPEVQCIKNSARVFIINL